jgi:HJR/Mrr/RecB family endonuclease
VNKNQRSNKVKGEQQAEEFSAEVPPEEVFRRGFVANFPRPVSPDDEIHQFNLELLKRYSEKEDLIALELGIDPSLNPRKQKYYSGPKIFEGFFAESEKITRKKNSFSWRPVIDVRDRKILLELEAEKTFLEERYKSLLFKWQSKYDLELKKWTERHEKRIETVKSSKNIKATIKKFSSNDFEELLADIYSYLGYSSRKVGGKNDGGIDIVAQKSGITYFIQCKHYNGTSIGPSFVRELVGAVTMRSQVSGQSQFFKAVFVTSFGVFSQKAREDAHTHNVHIIEIDEIEKMIKESELLSKSSYWSSRFGLTR